MTAPGQTYELFIGTLQQYGILSIIPFFLIFSIVFLILEGIGAFKKTDNDDVGRKLHAGFALGFSLMCIAHKPLIDWLFNLLPQGAMLLVAGLFLMMVIFLIAGGRAIGNQAIRGIIFLIIVGILIYIGWTSFAGSTPGVRINLGGIFSPELVTIIIILILFIALMWWFTSLGG